MKKTGIELITQERKEQIEKHDRTIVMDVTINSCGELVQGAIACLTKQADFPGHWESVICDHIRRDKSEIERLIIAGALIAAEIDRLQWEH